jgi:hypothetical protein
LRAPERCVAIPSIHPLRLLRGFRPSQRQERGWDCFGTVVPRNDKGRCHCEFFPTLSLHAPEGCAAIPSTHPLRLLRRSRLLATAKEDVIASPDLSGRGNLQGPSTSIASALPCLAMTGRACHLSSEFCYLLFPRDLCFGAQDLGFTYHSMAFLPLDLLAVPARRMTPAGE